VAFVLIQPAFVEDPVRVDNAAVCGLVFKNPDDMDLNCLAWDSFLPLIALFLTRLFFLGLVVLLAIIPFSICSQ
jgi:hypothetical protein